MNNTFTPLPIASNSIYFQPQPVSSLDLRQLKDYRMIQDFADSSNNKWKLVKSAYDSAVDVPDPNFVQVVDYWQHEFPGSNGKVYVYCIQGIKRPRVDTERPVQIMYQWFSTKNEPRFTPMMITQNEWCKANIFTAPLNDTRMSILNAFCGINNNQKKEEIEDIPLNLINGGNNAGRKK